MKDKENNQTPESQSKLSINLLVSLMAVLLFCTGLKKNSVELKLL